jgi:hypothetical protein
MLTLECSQEMLRKDGQMHGRTVVLLYPLRNFVGDVTKLGTYLVLRRVWNPSDFQGQGHRVKF